MHSSLFPSSTSQPLQPLGSILPKPTPSSIPLPLSMEEGAPSPASRPPASGDKTSSTIVPASPPPLTYIVQVPKDQIYRVPPKENARLAEQYRAHLTSIRSQRSPCLTVLLRFLFISVFIALPLLLAALILYIVVRPAAPIFNIVRVMAKSKTQYEIFMEVINPSIGMGYSIEKGAHQAAKLSYKGKSLADGEPPHFNLKARESKRFKLALRGAKKGAPEVSKNVVLLRLTVEAPVRAEIGSMRMWVMKMKVECEVRVKSLGKATRVLSQECKVKVQS